MTVHALSRSAAVAASTLCLVVTPVAPITAAAQHVTSSAQPALAAHTLPIVAAAQPRPVPDDPASARSATPRVAAATPIEFANAAAAAAYLAFVVPSLLFTVPLQLLTGQRSAVVTSLNNIITAVNTILALVGRSIPPIPTGARASAGDVRSAALVSDDDPDRPGAGTPDAGETADDARGSADVPGNTDGDTDSGTATPGPGPDTGPAHDDGGHDDGEPGSVDDAVVPEPETVEDDHDVVSAQEPDGDGDVTAVPEHPATTGPDGNEDVASDDDNHGRPDSTGADESP